jgi:aspartate racemase
MEQAFYRQWLHDRHGIEAVVPGEADRATVHRIIYDELCQGLVTPASKAAYLDVIARQRAEAGVDGVILGCTEITLLIGERDLGRLSAFDTTRLHADAAMDFALAEHSISEAAVAA